MFLPSIFVYGIVQPFLGESDVCEKANLFQNKFFQRAVFLRKQYRVEIFAFRNLKTSVDTCKPRATEYMVFQHSFRM